MFLKVSKVLVKSQSFWSKRQRLSHNFENIDKILDFGNNYCQNIKKFGHILRSFGQNLGNFVDQSIKGFGKNLVAFG